MPKQEVWELSEQLARQILGWEAYINAKFLYVYYPLGNEVSLIPVFEDAWKQGKKLAFPKVCGNEMSFYEVGSLNQLKEGCFHVMEPDVTPDARPVLWDEALCFVPGVVFDQSGGRFGYGKGYYDRYFSSRQGVRLAGCAYEAQVIPQLLVKEHDKKMDVLITEKRIYVCEKRGD